MEHFIILLHASGDIFPVFPNVLARLKTIKSAFFLAGEIDFVLEGTATQYKDILDELLTMTSECEMAGVAIDAYPLRITEAFDVSEFGEDASVKALVLVETARMFAPSEVVEDLRKVAGSSCKGIVILEPLPGYLPFKERILVRIETPNVAQLGDFLVEKLRKVQGVRDTATLISLRIQRTSK